MNAAGWQDLAMEVAVWGLALWTVLVIIEVAYKACKFAQEKDDERNDSGSP